MNINRTVLLPSTLPREGSVPQCPSDHSLAMPISLILSASISKPSIHLLQSMVGSALPEPIQIKVESRYPVSNAREQTQKPTAIFIRPAPSATQSHSVQPTRKDCILWDLSDDKRVLYPSDMRVYELFLPSSVMLTLFPPLTLTSPSPKLFPPYPIRVSTSCISLRGRGVGPPHCASVGRHYRHRALWRL